MPHSGKEGKALNSNYYPLSTKPTSLLPIPPQQLGRQSSKSGITRNKGTTMCQWLQIYVVRGEERRKTLKV